MLLREVRSRVEPFVHGAHDFQVLTVALRVDGEVGVVEEVEEEEDASCEYTPDKGKEYTHICDSKSI